jgi:hypothetical protein
VAQHAVRMARDVSVHEEHRVIRSIEMLIARLILEALALAGAAPLP